MLRPISAWLRRLTRKVTAREDTAGTAERRRARDFAQHYPPRIPGGESRSIEKSNRFQEYFSAHTQGRGIWKWTHYLEIYERHFAKFAGSDAQVVEIGIFSGGSLEMWRHYFGPDCHVTGIDIEEACRSYAGAGVDIVIGDQSDREFWGNFKRRRPRVDVLIDDGGHTPEQQRVTLEEMLPHLAPGGVYLCEDVHGTGNSFADYVHGLADELNRFEAVPGAVDLTTSASVLQQAIRSIHFYPFVVVIEKSEEPSRRFVAPKRGTQWEPFLS